MSFSQADYLAMLARTNRERVVDSANQETREADLHDKIEDYCTSKGWMTCHSRMDRPTTTQLGIPDFIVAADGGITYWIEAKRKGSKPTPNQLARIAWAKKLGHRAAIVWSFEEFLDVIGVTSKLPLP
jgi:predicted type IV restriction endonuclease